MLSRSASNRWAPPTPPLRGPRLKTRCPAAPKLFQYDGPLDEVDPEVASIIRNEKQRQVRSHPALVVPSLGCDQTAHLASGAPVALRSFSTAFHSLVRR